MTDALYNDPALAALYDWDNPWPADFDWFAGLVDGAGSLLDLGCGTGIFSAAICARGARVLGVDPAGAMLDIARARQAPVVWVEAAAQGLDLGQRFDAVVMTGLAFQTLLTEADRAAALATIARHLAPGGRFFFDSRNPEAREWDSWTPEGCERLAHPEFGMVERSTDAEATAVPGVIEYQTHYVLADGRHLQAQSRIAFPGFEALSAAGLRVDRWYGDAAGGPLRAGCLDFIPVSGLAC